MLDANMKTQLKAYLERLVRPVVITTYPDDSAKSAEMLALVEDIRGLSDKISVAKGEGGERAPITVNSVSAVFNCAIWPIKA